MHDKIQKQLTHLKATFYADSLYLYQLDSDRVNEAFNASTRLREMLLRCVAEKPFYNSNTTISDQLINSLKPTKLCSQSEILHNLLHSLSPDEMYLHLVNDYYRGENERYDTIVDIISLINQYFTEKEIIKRDIEYKAHLRKSIEQKPDLFDLKPIIYA